MVRIFCKTILTLCCTILLVAAAQARTMKEVYLRDGGIIECKKVWQANGKVMVLVNRDTLLDLSRSEVDLKKTFAKKHAKAMKKARQRIESRSESATAKPLGVAQPPATPAVAPATEHKQKPAAKLAQAVAKPAVPAVKAVTPAAKQPAAPKQPSAAKQPTAPPKNKTPQAAKQAVQQAATSAKKQGAGAVATTTEGPRANLPLAKPASPPEPQKSLLSGNMATIGLIALLVLLVIGLLVYKKKQQG